MKIVLAVSFASIVALAIPAIAQVGPGFGTASALGASGIKADPFEWACSGSTCIRRREYERLRKDRDRRTVRNEADRSRKAKAD